MDCILEQLGSRSLISHLSIVEFESVLAIKTRTGEIDQPLNTFIARACVYGYFAPVRPGQVFQREGEGKQCTP